MEAIYIIILAYAAGSIFFYYINIPVTVIVAGILVSGIVWIISKHEKKWLIFPLMFFLSVGLSYSLFVTDKAIENGKNYIVEGIVSGKRIDVAKLNGKYLKQKCYISTKAKDLENGSYKIEARIIDVKEYGGSIFAKGEIIGYTEGFFNKLRNYLREKLFDISYKYSGELFGFLKATLIGESDYLEKEQQDKFRYTGTAHIIVISGSHIAIIIAFVIFILSKLNMPYRAKYITALVILTLYVLILGLSDSILRAYIMGAIFLLSKILFDDADIGKSLAWSTGISIFINPTALFSVSFQLSYMAIIALVYIYPLFKKEDDNVIKELAVMSLVVQIMLMPIFLYHFHQIPVFSFLMNIIAVPLGGIIVQIAFIGLVGAMFSKSIAIAFGYILEQLIQIFYFYVNIGDKIPFLQIIYFERVSIITIIIFYLAIWFVLFFKKYRKREKILICTILIIISMNIDFAKNPDIFENYKLKYMTTLSKKGILVLNKEINERDVIELKTKGIDKINVVFCKKEIKTDLIKKVFGTKLSYILENNESGEIENITVKEINGSIQMWNNRK